MSTNFSDVNRGRSETSKIIGQRVIRPRQQVENVLREAILGGQLRPGDRLPAESELAAQFDVSRPTIREALSSLRTQGLIDKFPGAGGGSFVRTVDHHGFGELLQKSMNNMLKLGTVDFQEVAMVRQYLEIPSVVLAATNRTDSDLEELYDILSKQRVASVEDPEVSALDARFHSAIARMSGNRVLASMVYALHHESEPVHYLDLSPEVGQETVIQHRKIVKAIDAQDAEAARAAIIEHLTYLRENMKPVAEENTGSPVEGSE